MTRQNALHPCLVPLLAGGLLVAACGSHAPPVVTAAATPDAVVRTEPVPIAARRTPPGTPVTHLGRTVLPRSDAVVRARVERVVPGQAGMEIGHFELLETLHGDLPNGEPGRPLRALAGERGLFPSAGREAVLFLVLRPYAYAHDVVQVMVLGDVESKERVEALKQYLAVESIPTEEGRVAALKDHLRAAVRDPRRWTRANAGLEYGSLAIARPGDFDERDIDPILAGLDLARDDDAHRALEAALAAAQANSRGTVGAVLALPAAAPLPTDAPAPDAAAGGLSEEEVAMYLGRFREATDPGERRAALLAAAAALEQAALPVVRRGLTDEAPGVRDAALAAAGQFQMTSLGELVTQLLRTEDDPALLRSAARAVGYLRRADAVPTLASLARRPDPLGDEAAEALARIRDDDALSALLDVHAAAAAPRRARLAPLLDDAFEASERAAGRGVGPRP